MGCRAAAAVLAGCASAADGGLRAGQLLTARTLSTAAALSDADTQLITYASDDSHGRPVVVSGTVAVPKATPPEGGWPIISWARGTTGYADTCTPSADTTDGLVHDMSRGSRPCSTAGSRAARALDSSIGTRWVAMGHSRGDQAALFTAADLERGPNLDLVAAVAMAPGGVGMNQAVDLIRSGAAEVSAAQRFLPLLVLGAAVVDTGLDRAEPSSTPRAARGEAEWPESRVSCGGSHRCTR